MVERRRHELYCHNCNGYVQFYLDEERDGNHLIECPNCGHKHYRVVQDGRVTEYRWGRDPSQAPPSSYFAMGVTFSTAATTTASTMMNVSSTSTAWTGSYGTTTAASTGTFTMV